MKRSRAYRKHPEFRGLEGFVWEYLNQIGRPISDIKKGGQKGVVKNSFHEKLKEKPIWHNKSSLDSFVARSLNLRLEDYGPDLSRNILYKEIANEVGRLRSAKILIDWRHIPGRKNTGMGVWRLDKTKLEQFAYEHVKDEMTQRNFHSSGLSTMVFVRQKQNVFRSELLNQYKKCVFCGFRLDEYMIGAHIVPYSHMRITDADNSMNPTNGLLLCRLCDVAFERGSITVEEDFGIDVWSYLREQSAPAIKSWVDHIGSEIRIQADAQYPPDPKYLRLKRELLEHAVIT